MKKYTKIGLLLLVTVVLLLAMVIPGMAKKGEFPNYACEAWARVVDDDGVIDTVPLHGELVAYWEGGTLYNYCTGIVPWGETYGTKWRYLTFDEACEHFIELGFATCTQNIISIEQEGWPVPIDIFDPETWSLLTSDDSLFEAHRGSGKFVWFKEYTP